MASSSALMLLPGGESPPMALLQGVGLHACVLVCSEYPSRVSALFRTKVTVFPLYLGKLPLRPCCVRPALLSESSGRGTDRSSLSEVVFAGFTRDPEIRTQALA